MLVGDGISDLAARPVVDRLVGFGGVVARSAVATQADIFITAASLSPVLALATDAHERARLANTPLEVTLQKGLALLAGGAVSFKNEAWRQMALEG